jgi:hypothetical protein
MAYKLLGDVVVNPANSNMGNATLVYVLAKGDTVLVVNTGQGSRSISIVNGSSIEIVKKSSETIDCPSSECTAIAYHW